MESFFTFLVKLAEDDETSISVVFEMGKLPPRVSNGAISNSAARKPPPDTNSVSGLTQSDAVWCIDAIQKEYKIVAMKKRPRRGSLDSQGRVVELAVLCVATDTIVALISQK
jgi:hypothetical protein